MVVARSAFDRMFTPRREISPALGIGAGTLVTGTIVFVWCLITYGGLVDTTFCPPPHQVVVALWKSLLDGSLARNAWSSLVVINLGFFISSIIAIPLGIMMGSFRIVQAALEPIVNFIRYLPVTSMIPLLILWIGIGINEKIAVIFIGTFFQQLVMLADVSAQVPNELFNAAYTLGASKRQVVTKVLLPATLPGVIDTLRVTMGWAWTYLVVAELVASSSGLGYMSMQAMRGLHADLIFVAILVIGFLGLITDEIFKWVKAVALPWAKQR
jgi:NitT/TauT family transport system permease protein